MKYCLTTALSAGAIILLTSFVPRPPDRENQVIYMPEQAKATCAWSDLSFWRASTSPPLYDNMGNYSFAIRQQGDVQAYFDQGMKFLYGFNHAEAIRAFDHAIKLDSLCAMCLWGKILALGPNINDSQRSAAEEQECHQLAITALERAETPFETDLISTLAQRHQDTIAEIPRKDLNQKFLDAMRSLAQRYPDQDEVQTLAAAAYMNTTPWNYYEENKPKPGTLVAQQQLEQVIARSPGHPGAHHYYIHLIEASENPERGLQSADLLGAIVPASGHLVHMPSHIFARVGQFADAADVNYAAIEADEAFLAESQANGMYPQSYYTHNIHFIWYAETELGKYDDALDAAHKLIEKLPEDVSDNPYLQKYLPVPLQTHLRFGKWNEVLTTPKPPRAISSETHFWLHARCIAFARKGMLANANYALTELKDSLSSLEGRLLVDQDSAAAQGTLDRNTILREVAEAAVRWAEEKHEMALASLQNAIEAQDRLPYSEPPEWHQPVRQIMGKRLLELDRLKEAREVFTEDLKKNRNNGWSLRGLLNTELKIGDALRVDELQKRFEMAWKSQPEIATAAY